MSWLPPVSFGSLNLPQLTDAGVKDLVQLGAPAMDNLARFGESVASIVNGKTGFTLALAVAGAVFYKGAVAIHQEFFPHPQSATKVDHSGAVMQVRQNR